MFPIRLLHVNQEFSRFPQIDLVIEKQILCFGRCSRFQLKFRNSTFPQSVNCQKEILIEVVDEKVGIYIL